MFEEHSMFNNQETPLEKCRLGETVIDIPQELCEQKSLLKEVLSIDTWNHVLRSEHRAHLMKFLPTFPDQDAARKQQIINDLFSDDNFKFGNPLDIFHQKLKDGFFSPDISKMVSMLKRSKYQEYISQQQHYYYKLLQEILVSRKRLLESCSQMPPDQPIRMERIHLRPKLSAIEHRTKRRYYRELQGMREEIGELISSSEDENYPDGGLPKLNKRQKRQSTSLETSYTVEEGTVTSTLSNSYNVNGSVALTARSISPFEVSEETYRQLLLSHKMRRSKHKEHPEFDVNEINLHDVGVRANISKRLNPKQSEQSGRKKGSKEKDKSDKRKSSAPSIFNSFGTSHSRNYENDETLANDPILLKLKSEPIDEFEPHINNVPMEIDDSTGQNSTHNDSLHEDFSVSLPRASSPMLSQSTVTSFFALLRDFMSKGSVTNFTIAKLEDKVKTWQDNPFSGLNDWCSSNTNWSELVSSGMDYLNGKAHVTYPDKFISFVDHKDNHETWRWAGEGRDSDDILLTLTTHWLENRQEEHVQVTDENEPSSPPLPPPRVHTDWSVRPMTEEEKAAYRNQERRRYENPHMAYTIAMHGYESVVGPVKGVYGKETSMNKAREHSLLVSDRPPFVTILSLVRDAAARLPNGEGTRADICELLKASQYLSPSTDPQIHTVVSGALDRLHYESDPCVKYDVNRKMWIYLHRSRSEEDYERIHQEQMAAAKAKKSIKSKGKQSKSKASKSAAVVTNLSTADVSASSNPEGGNTANVNSTSTTVATLTNNKPTTNHNKQTNPLKTNAKLATANVSLLNTSLSLAVSKEKSLSLTKEPTTISASPKTTTARSSPLTGSEFITCTKREASDSNHSVEPVISSPFIITSSSAGLSTLSTTQADQTSSKPLINLTQVQIVGTTSPSSTTATVLTQASKVTGANAVAQLTVTQTPKTVGAIMAQQAAAAAAAAAVKNVTVSSQGTVKLVPSGIPHTTANLVGNAITTAPIVTHKISQGAIQGVPTIVFKQDGIQDSSIHSAMTSSKPVVARIISPPQVVSVGNLIASTLAASQKHGKPIQGTTTIKIQGSNMIRSVSNKTGHINMVQAATSSSQSTSTQIPRLTLVSQGGTTNLMSAAGTTLAGQPKFVTTPSGQIGFVTSTLTPQQQGQVSSMTKPTILATQGGIKIVSTAAPSNTNLAQLGKVNHTVVVTTKSQTPTSVSVTMGAAPGGTQNLVLASGIQSSAPAVVIASQRAIKPTQAVVMTTGPTTSTVVMATQQNLRPLAATTVTPMNMKTIHGVKVIPVTQAGVSAKGKPQPVFARIITPPTNLTLRPANAATLAATTTSSGIGVIHAMSQVSNNRGLSGNQAATLNPVRTSIPSNVTQATIIRIQGPQTAVLPTSLQDQTAKDST
ncbi:hypothetical protein CHUAL_000463 [Chamberlinius hualienensis]